MSRTIVVLEGDQTGQELLEEGLRVIDPAVTGVAVTFERFDLSLDNRRATNNAVVNAAAEAMLKAGLGLKAATITPEIKGDVRTGRRIPGVRTVAGAYAPIAVIRMAVGDAYGAKEWREGSGDNEVAYRTEMITRGHCRSVAEYAFKYAEKIGAKVFGGPKYTVSPVYEGMLKEEMDAAAKRHPAVKYEPQLIDATYALLLAGHGDAMVIPALNRDGDCLSDMVLQMFGSIAGSESLLIGFDEEWKPRVVMAEAPHGTAPSLFKKNIANPMAMILAGASLLSYCGADGVLAARAIQESVFEAVYDGICTADLQGHSTTSEFTDEVIARVRKKIEIWGSLDR